jgi:hypothetical protein
MSPEDKQRLLDASRDFDEDYVSRSDKAKQIWDSAHDGQPSLIRRDDGRANSGQDGTANRSAGFGSAYQGGKPAAAPEQDLVPSSSAAQKRTATPESQVGFGKISQASAQPDLITAAPVAGKSKSASLGSMLGTAMPGYASGGIDTAETKASRAATAANAKEMAGLGSVQPVPQTDDTGVNVSKLNRRLADSLGLSEAGLASLSRGKTDAELTRAMSTLTKKQLAALSL